MKTSLFHLGPPKTATTWLYQCLKEHPQIVTSALDRIHYFDMHYVQGDEWYHSHFTTRPQSTDKAVWFDPTYSYICSPRAPERIAQYNQNARLMLCLRNPVERAFSHYWHLKKTGGKHGFSFNEAMEHYNAFSTWVEHGFVAIGLEQYLKYFPKEHIYIMLFEDLHKKPEEEFQRICNFADIDPTFTPPSLRKKVNIAGAKQTLLNRSTNKLSRLVFGMDRMSKIRENNPFMRMISGKSEYLGGMDPEIQSQLEKICEPEIQAIESLTNIDLAHWRTT